MANHLFEKTKYFIKNKYYLAKNLVKGFSTIMHNAQEIIDVFEDDIISYNDFGISLAGNFSKLIQLPNYYKIASKKAKERLLKTINFLPNYNSLKFDLSKIMIEDHTSNNIDIAMKMYSYDIFPDSIIAILEANLEFAHKDDHRNFFKIVSDKTFLDNLNKEFRETHIKYRVIKTEEALENYIDSNDIEYIIHFLPKELQIFTLKHFLGEDFMETYRATLNFKIMEVYDAINLQRLRKEERKKRDRTKDNHKNTENKDDQEFYIFVTQEIIDKLNERNIIKTEFDIYVDSIIEYVMADLDTQKSKNDVRKWITRRFQQAYKNEKPAPIHELIEKFGINLSPELQSLISRGYALGYFTEDVISIVDSTAISVDQPTDHDNLIVKNTDDKVLKEIALDDIVNTISEYFEFEDFKKFKDSFEKFCVNTHGSEIKIKKFYFQILLDRRESRGNGIFVLRINAVGAAHRLVRRGKKIIRIMDHEEYEKFLNN